MKKTQAILSMNERNTPASMLGHHRSLNFCPNPKITTNAAHVTSLLILSDKVL